MTKFARRWQKIACYSSLVLFAVYLGYAGARWVEGTTARVWPSSFSPDGTKFVSLQFEIHGHFTRGVRKARIRDAENGSVIADLSRFDWVEHRALRWSPDGTHVSAVARDSEGWVRFVVVRVHPDVELVAEYNCLGWRGIRFDDQNRLITQHFCNDGGRRRLEFRTEGEVTSTFNVGRQEQPSFQQLIGDIAQVRVLPKPAGVDNAGNPIGEFLHTDGKQAALLWINRHDGTVVDKIQGDFARVIGTLQYVRRRRMVGRSWEEWICDRNFISEPIVKLSDDDRPQFVIGRQLLCVQPSPEEDMSRGADIIAYNLVTGKRKVLDNSGTLSGPIGPHQRPILNDGDRKFVRLDITDGAVTPLLDLTVSPVWQWAVMLGVPLLWALWMAVGVWFGSRFPFLDMIALCMLTVFITMAWMMLFLDRFIPELGVMMATQVALGTGMILVLIWGSTTKTFWGTLLPSSVACVATCVLLISIWSDGNSRAHASYRITEGLICCSVGLGGQIFGLWLLRKWGGRIARYPGHGTAQHRNGQMTLRQGLAMMVAFGVLFAVVREVDVRAFRYPGAAFLIWMLVYTTKMSFAGAISTFAALKWDNLFMSLFVAAFASSLYSVATYLITKDWPLDLLISPLGRCLSPTVVGSLVWIGMRYCRYHGFRFRLK